jgi:hypothetical protein
MHFHRRAGDFMGEVCMLVFFLIHNHLKMSEPQITRMAQIPQIW